MARGLLCKDTAEDSPMFMAKDRVSAELDRVRNRTHAIVATVPDDVLCGQHHELMGPLLWDLGHIAAFEDLWLVRVLSGFAPPAAEMGLNLIYNPFEYPRAVRGTIELPSRDETAAELVRVRTATLDRLALGPTDCDPQLASGGFIWAMVAQHEAWHQETMLVSLNLRTDFHYQPSFAHVTPQLDPVADDEMVRIAGGHSMMGTDDRSRAYDNERCLHPVELPDFEIDKYPVSNARYLRFVEATDATPPLGWKHLDGRWWRHSFGVTSPLDLREPVMHVSWHEAQRFAAWEGKRLPTEAEWAKAARWDPEAQALRTFPWGEQPIDGSRCNVDHGALKPARLGSFPAGASAYGCQQMLGDVWEWVEDALAPYPQFEAWPYEEFSVPFFENNRVLRGGSFATGSSLVRGSLRNWDLPERRQVFVGFRCARDV